MENIQQDLPQDTQRIANKLPTLAAIFVILIVLGFLFMKKPHLNYQLTEKQMLEEALAQSETVAPELLMNILFTNDSLYQFIDLRSPQEFIKGHLNNAINIPLHKLLAKENEAIFNQDKKINILYHAEHSGACGAWMLLKQVGYKNNRLLLGGYNYVKNNITDNFSPMTGTYKDEKAKFDFAKVIQQTAGKGAVQTSAPTENKTSTEPIKKKEKKGGGGGC